MFSFVGHLLQTSISFYDKWNLPSGLGQFFDGLTFFRLELHRLIEDEGHSEATSSASAGCFYSLGKTWCAQHNWIRCSAWGRHRHRRWYYRSHSRWCPLWGSRETEGLLLHHSTLQALLLKALLRYYWRSSPNLRKGEGLHRRPCQQVPQQGWEEPWWQGQKRRRETPHFNDVIVANYFSLQACPAVIFVCLLL